MISIHPPMKPSGGGKRVARFTVGTSTVGWTAADCDYLCDGTDDQMEINAAIQALPATGGEVVILDGTYNITAAIQVNKDGAKLSGNGAATNLQRMWASTKIEGIIEVTTNNCTIENLKLTGNKTSYTSTFCAGICMHEVKNISIEKNLLYNCAGTGIYGLTILNSRIISNAVQGSNNGIYMDGSDFGLQCYRNAIVENTIIFEDAQNGFGIYAGRVIGCNISGNIIHKGSIGIRLGASDRNTVTSNTISDAKNGVVIHNSNRNQVAGNSIVNSAEAGLLINSTMENYGIENLIVANLIIRGTGQTTDYSSVQFSIKITGTTSKYNLIAYNLIMGKNYTSEGGTGNTFTGNKYN